MCIVLGFERQVCRGSQGRRKGCEATGLELLGHLKEIAPDQPDQSSPARGF